MSWYNESENGETRRFLEWACNLELIPDDEPYYYKRKHPMNWNHSKRKDENE